VVDPQKLRVAFVCVVRDVLAGQHFGVFWEHFDACMIVDERNGGCGPVGAEADVNEVFGAGDGGDVYHVIPAGITLVNVMVCRGMRV